MKNAWKVIVALLAALILVIIGAEFGLRAYMAGQIREDMVTNSDQAMTREEAHAADISFGSRPLLLGMVRGTVPHLSISTPSTLNVAGDAVTGQPATDIAVTNLKVTDGRQIAEHLEATTTLPDAYLRAILNDHLASSLADAGGAGSLLTSLITVSKVTTDPASGSLTVTFSDGAAAIELHPEMNDGVLNLRATSTQLFGFELPDIVAGAITDALREGVADSTSGDMQVTDFSVVEGGVRVVLAGDNVDMEHMAARTPQ